MLASEFVMRLSNYSPNRPGERPMNSTMTVTSIRGRFFLVLALTIIGLSAHFRLVVSRNLYSPMHMSWDSYGRTSRIDGGLVAIITIR